jgi:hypothetical protein
MLWLGGFLSLDLTTSTPDALCPPLEEARAAVNARVGEVRGEYHADFALIRADDGRQALALTLRERDEEVLRRELPLDAAGCQDAAQTIALVLERYFDAIERPAAQEPEPPPKVVPELSKVASPPRDEPPADRPLTPSRDWGVRVGLLYDRELGSAAVLAASFHPRVLRLSHSWRWGIGLEVAPFFARQSEALRGERIEAFLLQGALNVPLTWSHANWRASLGPWAQLRLQRAEAPSIERGQSAYRSLPGVGAFVQVGLELTPSWAMVAGVAAGSQLRGAASRYVLDGAAGQIAVLVPDAWFGHAQLTLELKL